MKKDRQPPSCFHSFERGNRLILVLVACYQPVCSWLATPVCISYELRHKPRLSRRFRGCTFPPAKINNDRLLTLFNLASIAYSNTRSNGPILEILEGDEDDILEEFDDHQVEIDDELAKDTDNEDDEDVYQMDDFEIVKLPRGIPEDYAIVQQWAVPTEGLDLSLASDVDQQIVIERLQLSPTNVSLPLALMLLLPNVYPTLSRARKVCRKKNILLCRGPLTHFPTKSDGLLEKADHETCRVGLVGDRVYPGDVIAKQLRLSVGHYRGLNYAKPSFDLPVIFQDDHFAAVNKPSGIVVYVLRKDGQPTKTIRAALPFCLSPPPKGTLSALRVPIGVHRLDKPTSGILLCAKTRNAVVDLTRQFSHRIVKKTYVAIVNGIPDEPAESRISSRQAFELGVDVNPNDEATYWQLINHPLDGRSSITVWRALRYVPSLKAKDGYLTVVELKPKTGRYHQLRRHMAWVCQKPLVGDDDYDGGSEAALSFRKRGLFLCANRATLEHPFYNTESGRRVWEDLDDDAKHANGTIWLHNDANKVMVTFSIDVPIKFNKFLDHEEGRYHKFSQSQLI